MCDVLEILPDGHPDIARMDVERERLWRLIAETSALDWLVLTKRPENALALLPSAWRTGLPRHVWFGTTVELQDYVEERIPPLLAVPAGVHFLSCEPLRGPVDVRRYLGPTRVNWVLAGGER